MSNLISVYIRPHLVPFLYKELEAEKEARYEYRKSKLVRVTKMSVLGQFIYLFKTRAKEKVPSKISGYHIFLSFDANDIANSNAMVCERSNRDNIHIELLPSDVKLLNDLLESIFRISFEQFINGYVKNRTGNKVVNDGVHQFMLMHDLYNTDLDPERLRRLYYNSKKKPLMYRMQVPTRSQIKYYATA